MKSVKFLQIFFLSLISTGCVTLYKPNLVYSPLLNAKGDFSASAALGLSGSGLYNIQGGYAVSDHMAVTVDAMYHHRFSNGSDSSKEIMNMYFAEVGAGYYKSIFKDQNGLFQMYGGGGIGNSKDVIHMVNQTNPEAKSNYYSLYLQPGIAIIKENFAMSWDVRFEYVNLYNIEANLYEQFEWWNTDFRYYSDTTMNFMYVEPVMTIRVGGNRLKGVFQAGIIIPTIHSDTYFMVNTSSLLGIPLINLSAGISYALERKKNK